MAAHYADRIQATHPAGPYHLLGWSFGGVVAHQVAAELQRRGAVVALLILLDAEPTLSSMASHAVDKRQLDELLGGPGDNRLSDQIVANFDTNIAMYRDHQAPVFDGDLIMFAARRDHSDRPSFLQRRWQPHVTGEIVVHPTDCTHQAMLTTESLAGYGKQLGRLVRRGTM